MWIALYLVPAVAVAVAAWYVSKRFASFDPPNEVVRAVAVVVAGALWPIVLLGVAQLQLVRYVARRIRAATSFTVKPPVAPGSQRRWRYDTRKDGSPGAAGGSGTVDVHRGDGPGG